MPNKRVSRPESLTAAGQLNEAKLHRVLGYQLAQASIATTSVFMQQVGEPFGLRPVEFTVLSLINDNPGCSLARLAQALAVTAPNITMWIDRLEDRGLVRRARGETDRRVQHLEVTPDGLQLLIQASRQLEEGDEELLAPLSDGERTLLLELLYKVALRRPSPIA